MASACGDRGETGSIVPARLALVLVNGRLKAQNGLRGRPVSREKASINYPSSNLNSAYLHVQLNLAFPCLLL